MKLIISFILPCTIILFLSTGLTTKKHCFENEVANDSIICTYHYVSKFGVESILLKLYKNKTYAFSVYSHISNYFSNGKWEKKGNTFLLTSSMQKNEIPVTITYTNTDTGLDSNQIKIDVITNKNGLPLRDGEILTNLDTSISCYPIVGNCKIKREDLKSLQVRLEGEQTSSWRNIRLPENKNTIKIVVDVDFFLHTYKFFKNKEFIIKGNKLFDPERNSYYNKGPIKKGEVNRKNYY